MAKPKPKPSDIYKRAKGYGRLAEIKRHEERDVNWKPVAGFPEYEVNENGQVKRTTTGYHLNPYWYPSRPNDGQFVDFWINGQKHIISHAAIMSAAFPKEN